MFSIIGSIATIRHADQRKRIGLLTTGISQNTGLYLSYLLFDIGDLFVIPYDKDISLIHDLDKKRRKEKYKFA